MLKSLVNLIRNNRDIYDVSDMFFFYFYFFILSFIVYRLSDISSFTIGLFIIVV